MCFFLYFISCRKMSTFIGYFTEIDMLKEKIKELEEKLQEERQEYRDIFSRMKTENEMLKTENNNLVVQNIILEDKIKELTHVDDEE